MAAHVDILALQNELKGFQAELESWTRDLVSGSEQSRIIHASRMRELDGRARELSGHKEELSGAARALEKRLAHERAELAEVQQQSDRLAAEEAALPSLVADQRQQAAEKATLLKSQSQKLLTAEEEKKAHLDALKRALALYRDRLGLVFEREPQSERLRIVFTQIDAAEPNKPFSFAVHVQTKGDRASYDVTDVEPVLEGVSAMQRQLDETGDFSSFVRAMRAAFVALTTSRPRVH